MKKEYKHLIISGTHYTDDYFFKSDKCQSHIDYLNALKENDITL